MLIPKEERTNSPNEFKPILLCNVIHKIISKIIANGLKPIMNRITSTEQGGYIDGQQSLDEIIVAHETMHSLKITKNPSMLIKLDMSKAFDRLRWDFIFQMLYAFGSS
jgi:hypothetical protein